MTASRGPGLVQSRVIWTWRPNNISRKKCFHVFILERKARLESLQVVVSGSSKVMSFGHGNQKAFLEKWLPCWIDKSEHFKRPPVASSIGAFISSFE